MDRLVRRGAVVVALALVALGCGAGVDRGEERASPETSGAIRSANSSSTTAMATTTTEPPCDPADAVARWPLRRRIAQLLMPAVPDGDPAGAAALVAIFQLGGVFLRVGDYVAAGQVPQIVAGADPVPPFVSIDEEGGRVQRLDAVVGTLPSARQMGAGLSPARVEAVARQLGASLAARGVTMDLAPVADISSQPDDTVIGDRSFSAESQTVTDYAGAFAAGLRATGVVPVLKHFPGHGRASGDSHAGPVATPPLEDLRAVDLQPYEALLDREPVAVMMGHLDVPGLTEPGVPASLSPAALALLRDDLGFDGLVMTDDLGGMGAVTQRFGLNDASVRALNAGVDMLLWGNGDVGGLVDHLEAAVLAGTVSEARIDESVLRVLAVKGLDPCTLVLPGAAAPVP